MVSGGRSSIAILKICPLTDTFATDRYTPSQLIMISENRLAQFWEGFGHVSYYQRVDLDALMKV